MRSAGTGRISAAARRDYAAAPAARFVAALDASIARGELETSTQDLARLLGHPATPLAEVVGAAHNAASPAPEQSGGG